MSTFQLNVLELNIMTKKSDETMSTEAVHQIAASGNLHTVITLHACKGMDQSSVTLKLLSSSSFELMFHTVQSIFHHPDNKQISRIHTVKSQINSGVIVLLARS